MGWFIVVFVVLSFGLVVFRGAPYLPTKRSQLKTAFELLELKPGQVLIDLGSGDGTVLKAAAERGLQAIGYELNPILWAWSKTRLWRYRKLVRVRFGDFWHRRLPACDAVFVFLITGRMQQLKDKLEIETSKPILLASYTFELPGLRPVKQRNSISVYRIMPQVAKAQKGQ